MDGGPRRRARSHGRVTCTAAPSGPSPERPRSGYDTEIREQLPRSGLVQSPIVFQAAFVSRLRQKTFSLVADFRLSLHAACSAIVEDRTVGVAALVPLF